MVSESIGDDEEDDDDLGFRFAQPPHAPSSLSGNGFTNGAKPPPAISVTRPNRSPSHALLICPMWQLVPGFWGPTMMSEYLPPTSPPSPVKPPSVCDNPYSASKLIIILPTFFFSAARTTAAATQRPAATFFLLYKRLRYPLLQTAATRPLRSHSSPLLVHFNLSLAKHSHGSKRSK
ncbi:hypothetical protein ACFX2G_024078 [Malus domestica]